MATFGNTNSPTQGHGITHGQIIGAYFTGGPTSGTLQSVSLYCYGSTSYNIQFAVYGATNQNLIGNTSSVNITNTTTALNTGTVSGILNDPNGNYFICWNSDTGNSGFSDISSSSSSGGNVYSQSSVTFGTWPSTASLTSGFASFLPCIYFTYTTSSGTTVNFITPQTRMVIR